MKNKSDNSAGADLQARILAENTPPAEAPQPGHKWVKNLMSKKWIQIPIDTPFCCDPSTETYWSM